MFFGHGNTPKDAPCDALYSRKDKAIYLTKEWHCGDVRQLSSLLHELAHHLQYVNHIKARYLAEHETQAYHLQIEWLRSHGIDDPYKFLDIDELTIRVISQCQE
jgi:Domain of unknown function (DUF6647)